MYWEPGEFWEPAERAGTGDDVGRRLLAAERLCPGSRALAEALCVLGGARPPATVARVAGVPASTGTFGVLLVLGIAASPGGPQRSGLIALARESDRRLIRARLSPTRWRTLHRAAASVLDPRPALVHRALAADRLDPALAAELAEEALDGRAPDGEIGVPTRQLLVWAADLSPDRGDRERRLLLAALHEVYGEELQGGELWERVEALPASPLRSAALAGRALLEHRPGAAAEHLRAARRALADESAAAVIETVRAAVAGRAARGSDAVEAAARALNAAGSADAVQVRTARRLLLAGRAHADGPHEALRTLDGRADGTVTGQGDATGLLLVRGECRLLTGDLDAAVHDLDGVVGAHDARPGHPDRIRALERLAIAQLLLGRRREADSAVDRLNAVGGDSAGRALRAMLTTVHGDGPAPRHATRASTHGGTSGSAEPDRVVIAACADAIALLARRRHADLLTTITRLTAVSAELADAPAKFAPLWLSPYAEAAIESAAGDTAESALAQLRACAELVPYLEVTFHRLAGRAAELRRDPCSAEDAYRAGLRAAETCAQLPPLHRAQLDHAYGRFLCARGRTAAGLDRLQRAGDGFASLGALALAAQCAQDRAAAARVVTPRQDVTLTEREATVARLVTTGLTNRQVAEHLVISAKAVEYHLGRIYRKLGVRTRGELTSSWPG